MTDRTAAAFHAALKTVIKRAIIVLDALGDGQGQWRVWRRRQGRWGSSLGSSERSEEQFAMNGPAKMKQTASNATRVKTPIDDELALRWAWRDQLSKRPTSGCVGSHRGLRSPWWRRRRRQQGVVSGYAHIGLPGPDAEALQRAAAKLEPVVIDWSKSLDAIAGPLAGLVSVNDFKRHQPRTPKAGWGQAGERALRGWFGPGGERPLQDRPRDITMIGTFHRKTLLTVQRLRLQFLIVEVPVCA